MHPQHAAELGVHGAVSLIEFQLRRRHARRRPLQLTGERGQPGRDGHAGATAARALPADPPVPGRRHGEPGTARPEHDQVGDQGGECGDERHPGRDQAEHHDQADHGHPDPDHPAEQDHLAVQRDPAGHHGAQTEQRGQVEHVGADDYPGANLVLVRGQRGHRGGDFRCVPGQRGQHAEQPLGQAEPLADPFQPDDQYVTGAEADGRRDQEDSELDGNRHRPGPFHGSVRCRPVFPALRPPPYRPGRVTTGCRPSRRPAPVPPASAHVPACRPPARRPRAE